MGVQRHAYYVEQLFRMECVKRGLTVLGPESNIYPYDWVVHDGKRKFWKVQVKTTSYLSNKHGSGYEKKTYRVKCGAGKGSGKTHYRELWVDVLAIYIGDQARWYLIPITKVTGNNVDLYRDGINGYCRYAEAWEVFK